MFHSPGAEEKENKTLVVIRGAELGRRAAAGGRGRRVREEFADWEPRRLRNRGGISGTWEYWSLGGRGRSRKEHGNSGAGRELENPGRNEEETRELEKYKMKIKRRFKV